MEGAALLEHELRAALAQCANLLADRTAHVDGDEGEASAAGLGCHWATLARLRDRIGKPLTLAVLALVKSGKSSLINALVGSELMPVNNVPETARIVRILHDPTAKPPRLTEPGGAVTAGDQAIKRRLTELNQQTRASGSPTRSNSIGPFASTGPLSASGPGSPPPASAAPCTSSPGVQSSQRSGPQPVDDAISLLEVHAELAALAAYGAAGSAAGEGVMPGLALLDTPGTNEAGANELRYQVERLLSGVDAVLYLLDYTKLKTVEEAGMFARLQAVNPQLVQRLAQRLFFVVNKVDTASVSEGLGPEETREYVAQLVTRQMSEAIQQASGGRPCPPFVLHPEQVILVSARNALLARLELAGCASEDSHRRFLTLAFGLAGASAAAGAGRSGRPAFVPSTEQVEGAARAMLEDSGVQDLEHQVLTFLYTHSGPIKLLALLEDTMRLVQEVTNTAVASRACLVRGVEEVRRQAAALGKELQDTMTTFDEVMHDTASIADDVAGEVNEHLQRLRGQLFTHILQALDVDPSHIDAARMHMPSEGSAAQWQLHQHRGAMPPAGNLHASRWQRVRDRFISIFVSPFPQHAASGGAVYMPHAGNPSSRATAAATAAVPVARSRSRDEMASLLADLHTELLAMVNVEVGEFWHVLEACANSRHNELLRRINVHLERLSKAVEDAVSSQLDIKLHPVELKMVPPSAESFHSDLTDLIHKGIVRTSERHIRIAQRECSQQQVRREGICQWGSYWTPEPRVRTVVEAYDVTVWELQPGEIAAHFIAMVDNAIDQTQRALRAYISAFISKQLESARSMLSVYAERYLEATAGALDASEKGANSREAALHQVEKCLQEAQQLLENLASLRGRAELLVPCIQDPVPFDDLEDMCWLAQDKQPALDSHLAQGPSSPVQPQEASLGGAALQMLPLPSVAALLEMPATTLAAAAALGLGPSSPPQQEAAAAGAGDDEEACRQSATPLVAGGPHDTDVAQAASDQPEVEGTQVELLEGNDSPSTPTATVLDAPGPAAAEPPSGSLSSGLHDSHGNAATAQLQHSSFTLDLVAGPEEQQQQQLPEQEEEEEEDELVRLLRAASSDTSSAPSMPACSIEAHGSADVDASPEEVQASASCTPLLGPACERHGEPGRQQGTAVNASEEAPLEQVQAAALAASASAAAAIAAVTAAGGATGSGMSTPHGSQVPELIEYDDVPFDYENGFMRAMSTSGLMDMSGMGHRTSIHASGPAAAGPSRGEAEQHVPGAPVGGQDVSDEEWVDVDKDEGAEA